MRLRIEGGLPTLREGEELLAFMERRDGRRSLDETWAAFDENGTARLRPPVPGEYQAGFLFISEGRMIPVLEHGVVVREGRETVLRIDLGDAALDALR